MKVTLIKQFKNHPAGMELDVSSRVYNLLLDRGVIAERTPVEAPKRSSRRTKALKEPPADRMIKEEETKEENILDEEAE